MGLRAVGSHRGGRGHQDIGGGLTRARLWLSSKPGIRGSSRVKASRSSRRPRKTTVTTRVSGAGCWRMGGRGVQLPPAPQPMVGRSVPACWRRGRSARGHLWVPQPQMRTPPRGKLTPQGRQAPIQLSQSPAPDMRVPLHQRRPLARNAAGIAQGSHSHRRQPSQGPGVRASRPQAAPHPPRPPHAVLRGRQGN